MKELKKMLKREKINVTCERCHDQSCGVCHNVPSDELIIMHPKHLGGDVHENVPSCLGV